MAQQTKSRNWCIELYPESLPENWMEIISSWGFPMALSPLHDSDVYTSGEKKGEKKKAHYHGILIYPNTTTIGSIKKLMDQLNQPRPEACMTVKGAYEYFTHKNNPEKYQYDECHIKVINGFSILDYERKTRTESLDVMKSVLLDIKGNDLRSFHALVDLYLEEMDMVKLEYIQSNSYFIGTYLRSRKEDQ